MTSHLLILRCAVVAALGGFLFGFDTAVISGAVDSLQSVFELNAWGKGFAVSSALIGTVIGSIVVGKPADRFGRRSVMFALAILYFVSAVGSALAQDVVTFIIFRLIGGLAVGGASVVAPMYIAEIAPAKSRGRLVALVQFNIVFGILMAFASNFLIAEYGRGVSSAGIDPGDTTALSAAFRQWLDASGWRIMLGVEAIPALAYFFLLFGTPRSPRWLLAKGREDEARSVLTKLNHDRGDIGPVVNDIKASLDADSRGLKEPFFQAKYLKPILLAFAIAAFNQLSGINAILYYAPTIFTSAGFGEQAGLLNSVGLGVMNLVFTMIGLALIDHFGRKRLMLVGSVGYIISLGAAAVTFFTQSQLVETEAGGVAREFTSQAGGYVVFASLLVFIASHAVGQGAVIWVFISEIFPNHLRARGQAFGSFTHWIFAAVISQTFPLIAEKSGGFVFAFYALCMVGQLVWVLTKMPETKGVPLEEIQKQMEGK
ncbi:MAG: sugar porter family MFS transporter [Planctomycetota bacterium]